jgi:hypothetical protein
MMSLKFSQGGSRHSMRDAKENASAASRFEIGRFARWEPIAHGMARSTSRIIAAASKSPFCERLRMTRESMSNRLNGGRLTQPPPQF